MIVETFAPHAAHANPLRALNVRFEVVTDEYGLVRRHAEDIERPLEDRAVRFHIADIHRRDAAVREPVAHAKGL